MRNLHISLADLHYPKWDRPTINALLDFLRKNRSKVASFGFQGDAFDNSAISHHNKKKILYRTPGAYMADRNGFEEDILTPIEGVLPREAGKWYILGNHEDWEQQYVEENPELQGTMSHVDGLRMAERGWEIIPLGHSKSIGDLEVIHGEVLTGIGNQAGAFPAKKAMDLYGTNVLAAHTHAPQSFTKVSPVNHTKKYMAWIAPIGGNTNPQYLRNRPTAWLNGFTIIELHPNGHSFNLYPVIVVDGQFSFGGEIYGTSTRRRR